MILDKINSLLNKILLWATDGLVVNDKTYATIQTVMFIGTFGGILTASLAFIFNSAFFTLLTLVLILPPLAFDRIQMYLITLPDEDTQEHTDYTGKES